jgi:hypothetical protein
MHRVVSLVVLVPRQQLHCIRFHGVLASHTKPRAQIVPQEAKAPARATQHA